MRADGIKLKNVDPMYTVAAHIMEHRIDAMNMVMVEIPYEPIQIYVNKMRNEGKAVSHMAVIVAAYLQTVAEFPELNRFIVNKKAYARNEYAVAMVVLKGDSNHGTMSKMYFELTDNVFEVNRKIEAYIEENRNAPDNNGTEKMIKFLLSVPGLLNVGVPFFKFLDRYGLLPKKVIDMSPFHNSLAISNLISIRTNATFHHCYNFGTTSIFITMGNLKEIPKKQGDEIVLEKVLPLAVTVDDRICSGAYFAAAFRKMGKLLKHPELLENPPEKIIPDPGIKVKKKK